MNDAISKPDPKAASVLVASPRSRSRSPHPRQSKTEDVPAAQESEPLAATAPVQEQVAPTGGPATEVIVSDQTMKLAQAPVQEQVAPTGRGPATKMIHSDQAMKLAREDVESMMHAFDTETSAHWIQNKVQVELTVDNVKAYEAFLKTPATAVQKVLSATATPPEPEPTTRPGKQAREIERQLSAGKLDTKSHLGRVFRSELQHDEVKSKEYQDADKVRQEQMRFEWLQKRGNEAVRP